MAAPVPFTGYQKFVIAVLAFLQFTIILDFMILAPLGAVLMPALNISTMQFGTVVSVYAFSAGTSGLLAAGFADKFDRKRILLFFYTGFLLGTLLCGLANTYESLLFARFITGLFGGVIGSIVFAISTDLFPLSMRGRVMGVVQTSFAVSQVMGIPLGLYFSNHWGWHAPFMMIVTVSGLLGIFIFIYLKPIDEHLKLQTTGNAFKRLFSTLTKRRNVQAFATTALLSTGGFMLMPFSSAFSVNNLGVGLDKLPMVYMITGICSMIAGPLVGRASDQYGKFRTFVFGSLLTILMVLIYTNLGITPLLGVIVVSVFMFIGVSSRMVSSAALMSAVPEPASRGAFMSVNSSIQQISGGVASVLAGLIVFQRPDNVLERFDILGYVVVAATVFTMVMMYFIDKMLTKETGARI